MVGATGFESVFRSPSCFALFHFHQSWCVLLLVLMFDALQCLPHFHELFHRNSVSVCVSIADCFDHPLVCSLAFSLTLSSFYFRFSASLNFPPHFTAAVSRIFSHTPRVPEGCDQVVFSNPPHLVIWEVRMKTLNNTSTGSFVRKREMARILGVSVRTLENWMTARIIPYQKIGKVVSFNPDSVRAAIERKYTVGTLY